MFRGEWYTKPVIFGRVDGNVFLFGRHPEKSQRSLLRGVLGLTLTPRKQKSTNSRKRLIVSISLDSFDFLDFLGAEVGWSQTPLRRLF